MTEEVESQSSVVSSNRVNHVLCSKLYQIIRNDGNLKSSISESKGL